MYHLDRWKYCSDELVLLFVKIDKAIEVVKRINVKKIYSPNKYPNLLRLTI